MSELRLRSIRNIVLVREIHQHPENEVDAEYDRSRFLDVKPCPVPRVNKKVFKSGHVVNRKLHDKRRLLARNDKFS